MISRPDDIIYRNNIFAWAAIASLLVLLIPAIAMQFTDAVRWDWKDFVIMGSLLFGTGSLFVLAARRIPRKYRFPTGVLFFAALLYLWAELAVGIFTNLGS